MRNFWLKTFAGIPLENYFRHLAFGLIFPVIFFLIMLKGHSFPINAIFYCIINTILYPYSRFIYESFVNFILGNNMFIVNALLLLLIKTFTITLCWAGAIFIAPIGLIYLYYLNTKYQS
ncbi:hypothetical protein ELY21_14765 [Legionella sp. km535]|nr:hypothetical protein ELY21_14765 [Legionella sp. km535]